MKPSQHSTCKPPHTIARTDRHLAAALVPVARAVASVLCSPRTFQHAQLSLQAILSEIPRKNGWQIAEQARLPQPYAIQRLLSRATCDQDGVRDELRSFVGQVLTTPPAHLAAGSETAPPFPVLVLGESGFPIGYLDPTLIASSTTFTTKLSLIILKKRPFLCVQKWAKLNVHPPLGSFPE